MCCDFESAASRVGHWCHWHRSGDSGFGHSALWSIGLVRALCGWNMRGCLHSMYRRSKGGVLSPLLWGLGDLCERIGVEEFREWHRQT